MRVWVDLSNSPHPLLFAPITRHLQAQGHEVLITARDNAQTVQLSRERWQDVEVIGGSSPPGRTAKAAAIGGRVAALRRWAAGKRPDVALSHNSYAQIVAACARAIPVVTAMDYEYQPANHVAFRLAQTILLPEVISSPMLARQGAAPRKVIRYPGLKEELYVGDFEPDAAILAKVGVTRRPRVVAVLRPPPQRALYHRFDNPLFEDALRVLCTQDDVYCVLLPRHPEQRSAAEALHLDNCVVPHSAIDSRSLIYTADVLVGAGGTMTREAAVLGIPTWTAFAGTAPAVDRWLESQGTLKRLIRAEQLRAIRPRIGEPRALADLRSRAEEIERIFVDATLQAGGQVRRRSLLALRSPRRT